MLVAFLAFILIITLWLSYLMYVRLRMVQNELNEVKSQVMITDDEIDRIESNLEQIKDNDVIQEIDEME